MERLHSTWLQCAYNLGYVKQQQLQEIQSNEQRFHSFLQNNLSDVQQRNVRLLAIQWLIGHCACHQNLLLEQDVNTAVQSQIQQIKQGKPLSFFLIQDNLLTLESLQQALAKLDPTAQREYQALGSYFTASISTQKTNAPSPSQIFAEEEKSMGVLFAEKEHKNFGRYQIRKELGRGGMGKVYQAYDPNLNRLLALKVIIAGEQASIKMIERFKQEAKATAKLNHPNIVKVYDTGEQDNMSFFTMDYIEGTSLDECIKKGEIKLLQMTQIMAKVAKALEEAHRENIIHRDLKPANIMINQKKEPIIMDFGLAKMVESDVELSQTGSIMGTPAYMSPEQAQGLPDKIDSRSDVYSLGAILYVILTGRPPFQGQTVIKILNQVLYKEPVRPSLLTPDIPRDLEAICLKCLEKSPHKRYSSANALANDLENFIHNKPITARLPGIAEKFYKWNRRQPYIAGLLYALMSILVLLLLYIQETKKLNKDLKEKTAKLEVESKEKVRALAESDLNLAESDLNLAKSYLAMAEMFITNKNFSAASKKMVDAYKYFSKNAKNKKTLAEIKQKLQYVIYPNMPYLQQKNKLTFGTSAILAKKDLIVCYGDNINYYKKQKDTFVFVIHLSGVGPCISQDRYVAFALEGEVFLYDTVTKAKTTVAKNFGQMCYLSFSPNGRWLALCHTIRGKNYLSLISIKDKQTQKIPIDRFRALHSQIVFANDHLLAMQQGAFASIQTYKYSQKKWAPDKHIKSIGTSTAIQLSRDGENTFIGTEHGVVSIYNLQSQKMVYKREFFESRVAKISLSKDKRLCAVISGEGKIILLNLVNKKIIFSHYLKEKGEKEVDETESGVDIRLENNYLIAISKKETYFYYYKWKIEKNLNQKLALNKKYIEDVKILQRSIPDTTQNIFGMPIAISSQGRFIAYSFLSFFTIWDLQKNTRKTIPDMDRLGLLEMRRIYGTRMQQLLFSPNESLLACKYINQRGIVYNAENGEILWNHKECGTIEFSQKARYLLFTVKNSLHFYSMVDKKIAKKMQFERKIDFVKVSPDNATIAILLDNHTITLYKIDFTTLTLEKDIIIKRELQKYLTWHPQRNEFATHGGIQNKLKIYIKDSTTWKHKKTLFPGDAIKEFSFSPDGKKLAIFLPSEIKIYNANNYLQTNTAIGYLKEGANVADNWKVMILPGERELLLFNLDTWRDKNN